MIRRHPWIALAVPLAMMMLIALVLAFSSFLQFLFVMTVGLPIIGGAAIAAITLAAIWLARRGRQSAPERWIGFAAVGLALSVILCLPAVWSSQWIVQQARRPVRTMLAKRVIERARARSFGTYETVRLTGIRLLLNDDDTIEVYTGDEASAVSFDDWAGPMAGGWSVYVDDESVSNPPLTGDASRVERESAHWWRATADN